MKKVLILLIAAVLLLAGCKNSAENGGDLSSADSASPTQGIRKLNAPPDPTEPPTEAPTEPSYEELAQQKYKAILAGKLEKKRSAMDDVTALNQLDGMQAGCEAMALTSALTHFGYHLGIDDIVDDYLVYGDDFVTGYVGDPHYFGEGAGIYPPGMVTTAWNFIKKNDAPIYPFDSTGVSMDDLYKFLEKGCPILIWTTYNRSYPNIEYTSTYNGIEYPWFSSEHCVCLCGYDKEAGTVQVADSWGGYVDWEDAEYFEYVYDAVGKFSLVLMGTEDLK